MQTFLGSTIPEKWKPILKAIIPGQVLDLRNKWHDRRRLKQFRSVPTADAFTRIYEEGLWGVGSGHGSSDEFGLPYTDFVVSFGRKHAVRTIVDVGCGDLRIGRRIASAG